jgi:DNA polymerase
MPPGDGGKTFRKPNVDEIEYYKPYVLEIIRLSDPRIVLLAGNVACQSILGKSGITKLRGHWMEIQNRWVMPIFHPSYLLRNPSREPGSPKSLMWDDIREVRKKYNQIATH